jgi:A/G-specific adenine glycosylase
MAKNSPSPALPAKKFQQLILSWFDTHGRKTLPWQQNKNPYRVWLSEIMLQQTQVTTVIPYYERFMQRFPDVASLASATEDEVLHFWTGLGYYNRARHLHHTAKIIAQDFQGKFPSTLEELQQLPGIGRSTAGAILTIAFQQPAPILDGNVKRVLTRLHGITEWPGEKHVTESLWKLAEKYTPNERVADYTQAIMDMGATLCVRGTPQCQSCPLQRYCVAHLQGIAKTLPKTKSTAALPTRKTTMLVLHNKDKVLLEKRPPTGVWASLWSLPEISHATDELAIRQHCQQRFGCKASHIQVKNQFRHTFSHFHLDILPVFVTITSVRLKGMEANQLIWYNLQQPEKVGLPTPVKKLLMEMTS